MFLRHLASAHAKTDAAGFRKRTRLPTPRPAGLDGGADAAIQVLRRSRLKMPLRSRVEPLWPHGRNGGRGPSRFATPNPTTGESARAPQTARTRRAGDLSS